ncbi:alpha/beta hydrolase family protein [Bradyrhizobium sp. PMVTL-01]|uniref:alpha/beta hydrolase family protein n=1 Tax=Bradyrhizobium sp. PMVTL-01 TaxID=3434999 RepID=UPI003F721FA7
MFHMPADELISNPKAPREFMDMKPTVTVASILLPKTPADALEAEAARALPITTFYDTPTNLGASSSGDLLRNEGATEYTLPEGTKAQRILYRSLSAEGKGVVTSAVLLLPPGGAPRDGWPVIAWAHGSTGLSRQSAPSLIRDYYGSPFSDFLEAGFAVVATDYHGLGTEGVHQYCNGVAQGRDIFYSVKAARAAEPLLGKRWVVAGSGGAWGMAAEQHEQNDPDYRGAVAIAAGLQKDRLVAIYSTATDSINAALIVMTALAVKARTPDLDLASMLTNAGMEHVTEVATRGGFSYAAALYANAEPNTLLQPGWENLPAVERWFAELVPGERPLRGSILVIASTGDTIVTGIEETVARVCRAGTAVTFRKYDNLDHLQVRYETVPDQLAWIRDRFAGKPTAGNWPAT